jgi:hypothetical protein
MHSSSNAIVNNFTPMLASGPIDGRIVRLAERTPCVNCGHRLRCNPKPLGNRHCWEIICDTCHHDFLRVELA